VGGPAAGCLMPRATTGGLAAAGRHPCCPAPPGLSGRRGQRGLASQPAVVEPAAVPGWLPRIFGPWPGIAAVPEVRQSWPTRHPRRRGRFRRAPGRRRLVLAVRHPPAAVPDGARWRRCVRRHPVVLQGRPGLHRTLDLSPAPGTGRRGCAGAQRCRGPVIPATKPAAAGPADGYRRAQAQRDRAAGMTGRLRCRRSATGVNDEARRSPVTRTAKRRRASQGPRFP